MILIEISELGAAPPANSLHHAHWSARAAASREWRAAAAAKWRERNLRPVDLPVTLAVRPAAGPAGPLPDADASSVAAKAVLDGAVDAGVLPDDSPSSVASVVLLAPVRCGPGRPPGLTAALVPPVAVAGLAPGPVVADVTGSG